MSIDVPVIIDETVAYELDGPQTVLSTPDRTDVAARRDTFDRDTRQSRSLAKLSEHVKIARLFRTEPIDTYEALHTGYERAGSRPARNVRVDLARIEFITHQITLLRSAFEEP